MLDIKMVRANPDLVKQAMKTRNKDMDAQVDRVIAIDAERRELSAKADGVKARQKARSAGPPAIRPTERGISAPALSRSPARDGKRKSGRTVPPAAALLPQRTAKSAGARPETDRTRLSEPGEAVRHAATPGKGTGATSAS